MISPKVEVPTEQRYLKRFAPLLPLSRKSMQITGRRLGLDYGDRRIGISISDPNSIIVSPFKTVANDQDFGSAVAQIASIAEEQNVVVVYIGLPLHLSGSEGQSAAKVRDFAMQLKAKISDQVTLRLIDERLSTTAAQRQARESGKKLDKQEIDQWAAVAILEAAIEKEKISGELAGEGL